MHRSRRGHARAGAVELAAFAARVRERFPGAPRGEALRVARFACGRGTSRVGALSGGDAYPEHAVELAVIAHIRHRFTRYDALLDAGCDRDEARERVRAEVLATMSQWSRG